MRSMNMEIIRIFYTIIFVGIVSFFTTCKEVITETVYVEVLGEPYPVPEERPDPCSNPAVCAQANKLKRSIASTMSHAHCVVDGCTTTTASAHKEISCMAYDNGIWSSWFGRDGAFHEQVTDPAYSTTLNGQVVYPCFDDQDFLNGYDSAQSIIELMHPDIEEEQECTSADDCHSATWTSQDKVSSYQASVCAKNNCTDEWHVIWPKEEFFYTISSKVGQSGAKRHTIAPQKPYIFYSDSNGANEQYPCIDSKTRRDVETSLINSIDNAHGKD